MIENKESSFIVKGFCVRTIFFHRAISLTQFQRTGCVLTKIQLQNPAIIAYFDFYVYYYYDDRYSNLLQQ